MAKKEKKDSGQTLFTLGPDRTIQLQNGDTIVIPKLTWGIEAAALNIVGKTLKEAPEISALFTMGGDQASSLLATTLPAVLAAAPFRATELVACILGKKLENPSVQGSMYDTDYVEQTFVIEDVISVLIPFIKDYTGKLVKLAETITPEPEPEEVEVSQPQSQT